MTVYARSPWVPPNRSSGHAPLPSRPRRRSRWHPAPLDRTGSDTATAPPARGCSPGSGNARSTRSTAARRVCRSPLRAATRPVGRPYPPSQPARARPPAHAPAPGHCHCPRSVPAARSARPDATAATPPGRSSAWAGPVRQSIPAPGTPVVRSASVAGDSPPRSRRESSPGPPHRTVARTACSVSPRPSALAPSVVMGSDFNRYESACPAPPAQRRLCPR